MAKACVCSQVLTTTASKSAGLSNTLRKSVNFFASGCLRGALVERRRVHVAERDDVLGRDRLSGWPRRGRRTPMMAMFSLSLRFRPRETPARRPRRPQR